MTNIIIFGIAAIGAILLIIKEVLNLVSLRSFFKCEHCGQFNGIIRHKVTKCEKCGRVLKISNRTWYHMLIHRVTEITKKNKRYEYVYKSYLKYSIIEISVCSGILLVLLCGIVLELIL